MAELEKNIVVKTFCEFQIKDFLDIFLSIINVHFEAIP